MSQTLQTTSLGKWLPEGLLGNPGANTMPSTQLFPMSHTMTSKMLLCSQKLWTWPVCLSWLVIVPGTRRLLFSLIPGQEHVPELQAQSLLRGMQEAAS